MCSVCGSAYCWAHATPSATSCTSSATVNVGSGFLGDGGGAEVGGSGVDGGFDGGLEGGPPAPPPWGFLHGGGDTCPVGIGGMAGRRSLLVGGAEASRIGLCSARQVGSGGGTLGAVGTLVLEGLAGLRHSCRGSGDGGLAFGDPGRGIWVAIRRISSLARCSSSSTLFIFLWWSAAHSSTLPWKVARCWLQVVLASARKARASFTLVSWVA